MTTDSSYGLIQTQPSNRNGLLKTHFQFQLRKISTASYFCQSANIPGVSISTVSQTTVFNPIKHAGGAVEQDDLTVRFLVDEDLENWKEVFNWIKQCVNYENFTEFEDEADHLTSEAILFILDSNNVPRFKITFEGLFPNRLTGIQMDTTSPDSDLIYADASFSYTTFHIETI